MEYIICIILLVTLFVIYKFIFGINIKRAKKIEENNEVEKITNRFPTNLEIAEEMLQTMGNKDVKIEEEKETTTSLYIAITNKIIISDMKQNYGRIQTIAHEVSHSCQDRRLLIGNFVLSNILLVYYLITIILTICGVYNNLLLQLFILTLLSFAVFGVRAFLEIDAMTKSRFLAEKYIHEKNLCNNEEEQMILKSYDEINRLGIPFTVDNLFSEAILRIIVYCIICVIV